MVDYKITKKILIKEVNNDMAHNYYFLIYGRIYNENHTKYRKFKYVEWCDIFDVMEFFDKDFVNIADVKEYIGQLVNGYIEMIENFDDIPHTIKFYDVCNETLRDFISIM